MNRILKSLLLTFIFAIFALVPHAHASSTADLVVSSFALEDSSGHVKTSFAPNEPIYVKFTIKNQGTSTAFNQYTSAGNIWTQVYKNKPSTVATNTESDTYMWVRNSNFITSGQSISYNSISNGVNTAAFEGDNYWKISTPGTYTARVFVNYDGLAQESSSSNNQVALTYTIASPVTPTPTPTSTPTPTPTPTTPPLPGQPVITARVTASCSNGTVKLVFPTNQSSTRWAVRLDNTENGWAGDTPLPGDVVDNNVTANPYAHAVDRGYNVYWWVHLVSAEGMYSQAVGGTVHCSLPAPTHLVSQCNLANDRMEFSWDAVAGAVRYAIRTDDDKNGFANPPLTGDSIVDDLTTTSYNRHGYSGHHYNWWVHAVDRDGVYSTAAVSSCTKS